MIYKYSREITKYFFLSEFEFHYPSTENRVQGYTKYCQAQNDCKIELEKTSSFKLSLQSTNPKTKRVLKTLTKSNLNHLANYSKQ